MTFRFFQFHAFAALLGFLLMSANWEARGQAVIERNLKRSGLDLLKAIKRATEDGVFADPQKLNEIIPMTVVWREREKGANSDTWLFASSITLQDGLFFPENLTYRTRAANMWSFSITRFDSVVCVEFDELIDAWGSGYQLAPKLHRRHMPGSDSPKPSTRKMAGEGVIYSFAVSGYERRISARLGLDGCIESVDSWQIVGSK